ncbi:MAG: Rieske (2Fe-2S) protein [Actinomycetota bacterium]
MTEWVKVAELKELTRRRKSVVTVDGEPVALFLVGEKVYAFQDTCIHQERSLAKGVLLNGRVICPGHQWAFDLETGWERDQERCQPTYDVKVEDGAVHVATGKRVLAPSSTD